MKEETSRTERLIGRGGIEALTEAKVIIFGIGGVGGYCAEALARSGIGGLTLVDSDTVSISNINRQIIALHSTVGRFKTEVMAERIADINPDCRVVIHNRFVSVDNIDEFNLDEYDYVADCIDTVSAKLALAEYCYKRGIGEISAMGAGNKLDAQGFSIRDISQTKGCPLARVMRRELKKRGVERLKVVATDVLPMTPIEEEPENDGENSIEPEILLQIDESYSDDFPIKKTSGVDLNGKFEPRSGFCPKKRSVPGSIAYVPSVAGLIVAQAIITDIIGMK